MKKLILLLLFISIIVSAQNWTSLKESNINISNALNADIFTNGYGNHVIVQESNLLKYYKMDVNGIAGNPITLESTSVITPSISGDATRLYVVYKKSNDTKIVTKYSSDGGSSWSYLTSNPLSSNATRIECAFSNNRLHVTFKESNIIFYTYYNVNNLIG